MTGTLFLVATPIGNLEDITLRALRVLREVQLIAAEDTRRTAKLLAHFALSTPTLSFHEHNMRGRIPQLVARLKAGDNIGLVTDAGTPGLADPGVELVRACIDEGIPLDPVPGPSAPLAAVVASGFPVTPLTVWGFAPIRSQDRMRWLSMISGIKWTMTFFEAPHRIVRTLADVEAVFGTRPIMLAREVTKVHQQFLRGAAREVAGQLHEARGEITVVIGPQAEASEPAAVLSDSQIADEFLDMTNSARFRTRGDAISAVARKLGKSHREVFSAIERTKSVK